MTNFYWEKSYVRHIDSQHAPGKVGTEYAIGKKGQSAVISVTMETFWKQMETFSGNNKLKMPYEHIYIPTSVL